MGVRVLVVEDKEEPFEEVGFELSLKRYLWKLRG